MLFNMILIISVSFFLRLYILNSLNQLNILNVLNKLFLGSILFLFFITFSTLNYLLDYYQEFVYVCQPNSNISFLSNYITPKMVDINALGLNLVEVYYYPFIYVFLLVTVLSIVFCLTYNTDELLSFMLYCLVILSAGYVLFFTDSLILFFLSYEMLLIPSFFILYKFAKTRRCVEAAYLMFF